MKTYEKVSFILVVIINIIFCLAFNIVGELLEKQEKINKSLCPVIYTTLDNMTTEPIPERVKLEETYFNLKCNQK